MSELQGIARFGFHEGTLEEFKRLSAQCMEIVQTKDTGTLQCDIYFNDDQSECIVLERFRYSEALIEHTAHLGHLGGAILATGPVSGELPGEPSAELRAKLADSPVISSRPSCQRKHRSPAWAKGLLRVWAAVGPLTELSGPLGTRTPTEILIEIAARFKGTGPSDADRCSFLPFSLALVQTTCKRTWRTSAARGGAERS